MNLGSAGWTRAGEVGQHRHDVIDVVGMGEGGEGRPTAKQGAYLNAAVLE
jgi:hypothetical protein